MVKRRRDRGDMSGDLLSDLQGVGEPEAAPAPNLTASGIADQAYGSTVGHNDPFAQLGRNREKIVRKSIEEIFPNATQPRRAVPSALRHYWNGNPSASSMGAFYRMWVQEVELERGNAFPLHDFLSGKVTERSQHIDTSDQQLDQIAAVPAPGPKEAALMRVVDLAASIRRDGLTNPISIAQKGSFHEIETGERRWLAYHLLNWCFGAVEEDWSKIPARVVEQISIWRQASENNARADLNAIGKARQFALLLMDLLVAEEGVQFQPFSAFEGERDYYAQVSDGNLFRVPRNRGEDLLNAMGLENPVQLRQYRALLRLPQPVWEWADDLNWTESFIRKELFMKAATDDDLLRIAVQQALAQGYTVSTVTVWEHLLHEKQSEQSARKYSYTEFQSNLMPKVYRYLENLSGKERDRAIATLEEMLAALRSNRS